MLGVDLMKLQEQQLKKLRECEERQALIKEGLLGEHEEISVLRARKRWYEQRSREALHYRRAKAPHVSVQTVWPECPRDRQVYEMTCWLKKTLPADELYGYSADKLEQLAVRHLYQLELSLNLIKNDWNIEV